MSELFKASNQWATRPADERFKSLGALLSHCKTKRANARQVSLGFDKFDVEEHDGQVVLTKGSRKIGFSNWAFTQFCSRVGQKPKGIDDLPADLVVPVLRYRLDMLVDSEDQRESQVLLSQEKDGLRVRAFNGNQYTRVWDYQVAEKLVDLQVKGWKVPPAFEGGTFGGKLTTGSGIYCGDRDMFVFMVNDKNRINDGTDDGLARGFFIGNSEVGGLGYNITTFLYRYICGNHIVWGAEDVVKFTLRHVGDADQKAMAAFSDHLLDYANRAAGPLEAKIKKAKAFEIADNEDDVVDTIFNKRILPRKTIQAALKEAALHEEIDGSPWSAWGLAQGVSRISQREDYARSRVEYDNATNKILALAN